VNSTLYLMERLRERAHLPPLSAAQHDLSDALSLLCEVQLAISWMIEHDPENAALRVIGDYLTREMARLDVNLQNAAPAHSLWMDE
jgi:hypothetical protein